MKPILALSATLACLAGAVTAEGEFDEALKALSNTTISGWAALPEVVTAIRAQNARTAGLSEDEIIALDRQWRHETVSGGPLIDSLTGSRLSHQLIDLKTEGRGQFTEIFVTDIRGLNVAQSDVTSDYWQGDEAKWQVPHETRRPHFGEVEFDESTQTYQSQVSVPVIDGGDFIGVVTVGIDLELLASAY